MPPIPWTPRLARVAGPVYRAIADALEADIRGGRLAPGDALPTQRDLADRLGVNFTTVTRAYGEARRRGLLAARVGSGTFVAPPAGAGVGPASAATHAPASGDVDLSVNTPPVPGWMGEAFRDALARAGRDADLVARMVSYRTRADDLVARSAGASWLAARGLAADPGCVVVAGGAQHALALLLGTLARPGDTVLVEALAYPGLEGSAAAAGVRLVGVPMDGDGIRPDALDAACRRHRATVLCCVPTLQNPTTIVMPLARRQAVLAVAAKRGLRVVEDDICGPLLQQAAPPPLAALAPELVTYVGSLSKCVAPGLRTAFVLPPTRDEAARLEGAVRASVLMLSPLPVALAAAWIADGTAERAVRDIGAEAAARGAIAWRLLGEARVAAPPGSIHAWLQLPASWTVAAFVAEAQQQGVRVTPADGFVRADGAGATPPVPNAVRLALGGAPDRASLERALRAVAGIVAQPPAHRASSL